MWVSRQEIPFCRISWTGYFCFVSPPCLWLAKTNGTGNGKFLEPFCAVSLAGPRRVEPEVNQSFFGRVLQQRFFCALSVFFTVIACSFCK